MRKLGKWCFTHRLITVLAWVVTLVALTAIHSAAGSAYSDNFDLSGTQSFDAVHLLQRAAPKASGDREQIVIAVENGKVTDPAVRSPGRVDARERREAARMSRRSSSPYGPAGAAQISPVGPDRVRERPVRRPGQQDHGRGRQAVRRTPRAPAPATASRSRSEGQVARGREPDGRRWVAVRLSRRAGSSCSSCSARCWRWRCRC